MLFSKSFIIAAGLSFVSANDIYNIPPCTQPYTPFIYSGCYTENTSGARALPFNPSLSFNSMTVERCTAACKSNGYRYAGLEYYGQCCT